MRGNCEHGVSRHKRCLECYLTRELGAALGDGCRRKLFVRLNDAKIARKNRAHARTLEPRAKELLAKHAVKR